mmetsp:Transcript_160496/g.515183  ORF Transcript_160496/g.515183 Transcript_160496/m.515183 type:complete len:270 (+) Transcript_160496:103-912(+)
MGGLKEIIAAAPPPPGLDDHRRAPPGLAASRSGPPGHFEPRRHDVPPQRDVRSKAPPGLERGGAAPGFEGVVAADRTRAGKILSTAPPPTAAPVGGHHGPLSTVPPPSAAPAAAGPPSRTCMVNSVALRRPAAVGAVAAAASVPEVNSESLRRGGTPPRPTARQAAPEPAPYAPGELLRRAAAEVPSVASAQPPRPATAAAGSTGRPAQRGLPRLLGTAGPARGAVEGKPVAAGKGPTMEAGDRQPRASAALSRPRTGLLSTQPVAACR